MLKNICIFILILLFVSCSKKEIDSSVKEEQQVITQLLLSDNLPTPNSENNQNIEALLSEIFGTVEVFMDDLDPKLELLNVNTNRNYPYMIRAEALDKLFSRYVDINAESDQMQKNIQTLLPIIQQLLDDSKTFKEKIFSYAYFAGAYFYLNDSTNFLKSLQHIVDKFEKNPEQKTDKIYSDVLIELLKTYRADPSNIYEENIAKYCAELVKYNPDKIGYMLQMFYDWERYNEANELALEYLQKTSPNKINYKYVESLYKSYNDQTNGQYVN